MKLLEVSGTVRHIYVIRQLKFKVYLITPHVSAEGIRGILVVSLILNHDSRWGGRSSTLRPRPS